MIATSIKLRQKLPLIITLSLAIIAGVISLLLYFGNGQNIIYGDARSHLNIARRVFDSTNPGLAQLGGVWLPLLHLLMLPTITNNFFWHSGLSGITVNFPAFILSVFFLFKIGELLFKNNRLVQILIPLLYILNPNILYMSTTPMTEVLFIATFTGSIYFLLQWTIKERLIDLVISGFFFFLTSVNRYEGWSIGLSAAISIVLISLVTGKKRSKVEGNVILFSTIAFIGILFWLIWQLIIFKDPLYFLHSIYSSKFQTLAGIEEGSGSTYYQNFGLSLLRYAYVVMENAGFLYATLASFGFILTLINMCKFIINKKGLKQELYIFILFILITPFLFLSYAVYKGNVPLVVPQLNNGTFNIRLGMYMIPSVTILILFLVKKIAWKKLFLIIILTAQLALFSKNFIFPITLQAGNEGIESKIEVAKWFKNNYKGGKILASSATGDPLLFDSHLQLKEFITDGSAELFTKTLEEPRKYVEYIVMSASPVDRTRDLVYIKFSLNRQLLNNYQVVFTNKAFEILKLKNK